MYPNMPMELCETGIREYLDGRPQKAGNPSTDNVIKCLRICQENNIFEFMGKFYRQTRGSAIGQKQAPAVACLGAGEKSSQYTKNISLQPAIRKNSVKTCQ